jgi:hypothetical protein
MGAAMHKQVQKQKEKTYKLQTLQNKTKNQK